MTNYTPRQVEAIIKAGDLLVEVFGRRPNGTKADQLIDLLKRPKGATIDEIVDTFGIKRNSAYARISVETRKRHLKVAHKDGRYRVHA